MMTRSAANSLSNEVFRSTSKPSSATFETGRGAAASAPSPAWNGAVNPVLDFSVLIDMTTTGIGRAGNPSDLLLDQRHRDLQGLAFWGVDSGAYLRCSQNCQQWDNFR